MHPVLPECDLLQQDSGRLHGWQCEEVIYEGCDPPVVSLHVVPCNDLRAHVLCRTCWCGPSPEPEADRTWVHNSDDGRERYEPGRGGRVS